MKTTELYDSRNPRIHTEGREIDCIWCYLRIDAGFAPEDEDHSRGYVRMEVDSVNAASNGGVAFRVLRGGAIRDGQLKDVLEIHSLGDGESSALGEALVYAGLRLLRQPLPTEYVGGEKGILHDSPFRSVWGLEKRPQNGNGERDEWEDIGKGPLMDGIYSTLRHRCGTVVNIAQGCVLACPKCNPEDWAKERGQVACG
ncbi:MAG: hypothetical protein ACLGSD_09410 [Acidobacteriota bacterium]